MIRIQFEVSPSLAKEIESYENEGEIGSHREFYANLIALWRWAANHSRNGENIAAIDSDGKTISELTMPSLEMVKYKAIAEKHLKALESQP